MYSENDLEEKNTERNEIGKGLKDCKYGQPDIFVNEYISFN